MGYRSDWRSIKLESTCPGTSDDIFEGHTSQQWVNPPYRKQLRKHTRNRERDRESDRAREGVCVCRKRKILCNAVCFRSWMMCMCAHVQVILHVSPSTENKNWARSHELACLCPSANCSGHKRILIQDQERCRQIKTQLARQESRVSCRPPFSFVFICFSKFSCMRTWHFMFVMFHVSFPFPTGERCWNHCSLSSETTFRTRD